MPQVRINKTAVDSLQKGETKFDTEIPGFHVRCLPSGKISYGYRYRTIDGKRPMLSLGLHGEITPDQARTLAKKAAGKVADNQDPAAQRDAAREQAEIDATKTINAILDEWVKRHVDPVPSEDGKIKPLKSAPEIKSRLDRFVRPALGEKVIYHPTREDVVLTRDDIVDMMDEIEDESGPSAADAALADLRAALNWQMLRDRKFTSPIIRGMNRVDQSERRGKRILTDEEIRDVWIAAERAVSRNCDRASPATRYFVRLLILTAQRRTQVARWHWSQMDHAGWMEQNHFVRQDAWIVEGSDYKNGQTQLLPVTAAMRQQFQREYGFLISNDDGVTPFNNFHKAKMAIDKEIELMRSQENRKPMPKWTFHDLRRTARSIMSRYTTSDIAERVLGHAIPGVRGVYDHYEYIREKREALEKLAVHVLGVVHPQPDKVVEFRALHG